MKIGKEVEGRHKGIQTFFVSSVELQEFIHRQNELMEQFPKCRHIYISQESSINISDLDKLNDNFYITIETTNVDFDAPEVPEYVHIMLRIESDNIWKLRDTDSIKFHSKDMEVFSIAVESLIKTKPEAFLDDVEI